MTNNRLSRAGFTLLELMLVLALIGIVVQKAVVTLSAASRSSAIDTSDLILEERARQMLEQIALAVMGSNRETLAPALEAPFDTSELQFQLYLGLEDGEVVWSDPEKIGQDDGRLYFSRRPGTETEQRIVWTNLVRPFLEGETLNGMDDNGNGVIDEKGLSFVVDRDAVTIRLSLDRPVDGGGTLTKTVETTVTCRNLGGAIE